MIFNRETECERCNRSVIKKEIIIVDTTNDRRNKSGIKKRLCKSCLNHEIYQTINENKYKSILIHPMRKFNSYVYYNFSDLLKESASQHLAIDLQKMLPTNYQNCRCGNIAQYSLCSPKIFDNDPWNWEVMNDNEEIVFLCKDCAYNYLIEVLKEPEIDIKYFYTYIKSEGFFTPWDI